MFTIDRLCVAIIKIIFVLVFAYTFVELVITFAVIKPKNPTFTVDKVWLDMFDLSKDDHLTAFFSVRFQVYNPNHILKHRYSWLDVYATKAEQDLAVDVVPKFKQGPKESTVVWAEPVALSAPLGKEAAFDWSMEKGTGYVGVGVYIRGYVNGDVLSVTCGPFLVSVVANNRSGIIESGSCHVYVHFDG